MRRYRNGVLGVAVAALLIAGSALLSLYGVLGFVLTNVPSSFATVSKFNNADFVAFQATPSPNLGTVPALACTVLVTYVGSVEPQIAMALPRTFAAVRLSNLTR